MVVSLAQAARWSIGWQAPLPLWVWAVLILGIAATVTWAYTRLSGPRWARALGGSLRFVVLLAIALLLAEPQLIWSVDRTEPDRVEVLIDRSRSMTLTDSRLDQQGQPITRDQAARQSLTDLPAWVMTQPDGSSVSNRTTTWSGFSDNLQPLDTSPETWAEPDGRSTRLASALQAVLDRSDPQSLAGIVLVTDGRADNPLPSELLQQLEQQAVPIHAVILGGKSAITDIAIADVQAPRNVFLGDRVPIHVTLQGTNPGTPALLRVVDKQTGETLEQITTTDGRAQIAVQAETSGRHTWTLQVVTENDQIAQNNQRDVDIRVVDRPIRALLVDGYPRWEFRFLKNLLIREKSVELSSLLLSADRGFAQEGDRPIQRLPEDEGELEPYDLIIVGDIPVGFLTATQRELILKQVSEHGAGLIWIGGSQHTPIEYDDTTLAPLLPVRSPASVSSVAVDDENWTLFTAPAAESLGLIQPGALATRRGMTWMQTLVDLKPTAEPLMLASHPRFTDPLPAITWMRYGAGQSIYLATDEWWRWRYTRGETPYGEFWLPIIRLAVRDRLEQAAGDEPRLIVNPAIARVGQTVVATYTHRTSNPPRVAIYDEQRNLLTRSLDLLPENDGPFLRYSAPFLADTPGTFTLRAGINGPATRLTVLDDSPEFRHTQPDRDLLQNLTRRTGGRLYDLDEASQLAGAIPSRARTIVVETREQIWSSWPIFLTLIILLTAEWITRRVAGLS